MKSILNDVNRLEKAWELFTKLTTVCIKLYPHLLSQEFLEDAYESLLSFNMAVAKANVFIEKYGDPSSHTPDSPN